MILIIKNDNADTDEDNLQVNDEGADSKVGVKVERREEGNNDDEDFDPSQYYRWVV